MRHDIAVQNLIMGAGRQAVLPATKDQNSPYIQFLPISDEKFGINFHINYLNAIVQQDCAKVGNKSLEYKKCQRNIYPHYVNFSMSINKNPEDFTYEKYQKWPKEERQRLKTEARDRFNKKSSDSLTDLEIKKFLQYKKDFLEEEHQSISSNFTGISYYSTLVQAAGNSAGSDNKPISSLAIQNSQSANAIIVGSLAPNGDKSDFSQEHPEVHIMAPADNSIRSVNSAGEVVRFGGTSASTPLVTGALSAFNWMSGYHPTPEEAKILLQMTAIPHKYSNNQPRKNGFGMLNAYKMGMMGKKLKERCGKLKKCMQLAIRDAKTYELNQTGFEKGATFEDFSSYMVDLKHEFSNKTSIFEPDKTLLKDLKTTFPECSQSVCAHPEQTFIFCSKKREVFNRLRKQAFLMPTSPEVWRYLSCIYGGLGLKDTSELMSNSYVALTQQDKAHKDRHYCQMDEDCVLVPKCLKTMYFGGRGVSRMKALNKMMAEVYYNTEYYGECNQKPKCNGKCRCGNEERVSQKDLTGKEVLMAYKARCVQARCVLSMDKVQADLPQKAKKPVVQPVPALKGFEQPVGSSSAVQ